MVRDYAASFPFEYEPLHRFNLGIYLTPLDRAAKQDVLAWLQRNFTDRPKDTVAWLFALNRTINQNIAYQRRDELGIQPAATTITLGSGSCRDFAVLLIACARTLGLAARFVSGYLYDPGNEGFLAGDMHAWAEVFLPGAGWRGLDPTQGIFCDNAYVPVAHAVVAESVNPIQGSFYSATPAAAQLKIDARVRLAAESKACNAGGRCWRAARSKAAYHALAPERRPRARRRNMRKPNTETTVKAGT